MFAALSKFLQHAIDLIILSINLLFSLFPDSPFRFVENLEYAEFISQINFFVPIYEFLAIAQAWIIAVAIFYIYYLWAKWVNVLD